jgi:hypothetical protein
MTVSITFSHDDQVSARWVGVDGGRPMTYQEINLDLYNIKTSIETLQDNYSATISIATVTQPASNAMRVTLTDASYFDLTLPIGRWRSRGDWAVSTAYLVDDIFNAPDGGLYQTIFDHTSDDTAFDPAANDGIGHDYYFPLVPARGNVLPSGGAAGMAIAKNTGTDFDYGLKYILPSTGSARQVVIRTGSGPLDYDCDNVAAADVTFTPSTGPSPAPARAPTWSRRSCAAGPTRSPRRS